MLQSSHSCYCLHIVGLYCLLQNSTAPCANLFMNPDPWPMGSLSGSAWVHCNSHITVTAIHWHWHCDSLGPTAGHVSMGNQGYRRVCRMAFDVQMYVTQPSWRVLILPPRVNIRHIERLNEIACNPGQILPTPVCGIVSLVLAVLALFCYLLPLLPVSRENETSHIWLQ